MCIRDSYIAFYSSDIQERTADGLICKRPAGNTYKIQDDAWALDFYYAHKDDTAAQLVHAVPVSYTHLDVYKRQHLPCLPRKGQEKR